MIEHSKHTTAQPGELEVPPADILQQIAKRQKHKIEIKEEHETRRQKIYLWRVVTWHMLRHGMFSLLWRCILLQALSGEFRESCSCQAGFNTYIIRTKNYSKFSFFP